MKNYSSALIGLFMIIFFFAFFLSVRIAESPSDKEVYIVRSCGVESNVEVTKSNPEEYTGIASWYDYQLEGVWYSKDHATAASRSLERYSYAKVTNISNGKSVVVRINDFGPEAWTEREIDLSSYAFSQIADLKLGLVNVKIEPLQDLSTTNDN